MTTEMDCASARGTVNFLAAAFTITLGIFLLPAACASSRLVSRHVILLGVGKVAADGALVLTFHCSHHLDGLGE